jgi:hypothetical protein
VQSDQGAHDQFSLQADEAGAVAEDQGAHAHTPLASTVYYDVGEQTADAHEASAEEAAAAEDYHGHEEHHDEHHAERHEQEAHEPAH